MAVISSAMADLKITFQESTLVFPSHETEKRSLFLSNIDLVHNLYVPTASFYPANPDYPPHHVSKRLKLALEKVLVPYDFMAGRLKMNHDSGRLEVDCNRAGAGFVVASSELSLDDVGDLVCPNLGYKQLAVKSLIDNNIGDDDDDDQLLFLLQLTSFKCGGFAIGMSVNHILLDGMSAMIFQQNLASQAFDDKPLAIHPLSNRGLLAARSPPLASFEHREYFIPDPTVPPVKEELVCKIFQLSPTDISFLKDKAKSDPANKRISSFNVTAALIWLCKAKAFSKERQHGVSTLLTSLDLRSRLDPPLPYEYCGNAVVNAVASAKWEDVNESGFAEMVNMLAEAQTRVTDSYGRSAIDWIEMNKGSFLSEDYRVTSWMRLGFDGMAYPWGKPIHSCPVSSHTKNLCRVCSTHGGHINAFVSLPAPEMERFQSEFHKFFAYLEVEIPTTTAP